MSAADKPSAKSPRIKQPAAKALADAPIIKSMNAVKDTPHRATQLKLAQRFRAIRESRGHSRARASELTGVAEPTLRHFEQSGEISLRQLLLLAAIYGNISKIMHLMPS